MGYLVMRQRREEVFHGSRENAQEGFHTASGGDGASEVAKAH